ncbi:rho-related BTB domain-containing protein 1-like [Styela clava]
MASTTENPSEENIKCVVVGDNNVGKTRLVCARAHSQYGPNNKYRRYGGTHIPTVWAIDHYRNDNDVLDKARDCIDGVNVSLRLWDTFGDHNKNRKFSYGRADVIIICFSICDSKSLHSVKTFWYPEARRHCKGVPIIVVGCKIDLRFADLDDLNKHKNTLAKKISSNDILYPEICRQTASEIECPYYETSVFRGFGIKEVFENTARAALMYRRKMYLYRNVHLRHVQKPLLQRPLIPPKPEPPKMLLQLPECSLNFSALFNNPTYSDLLVVGENFKFHAHKVILAISSDKLHRLFTLCPANHRTTESESSEQLLEKKVMADNSSNDVFIVTINNESSHTIECKNYEDQVVPDLLEPTESCTTNPDIIESNSTSLGSEDKRKSTFSFLSSYKTKGDQTDCDLLRLTPDVSQFAFMNILYYCYYGYLSPDVLKPNWFKDNIQQFTDLFLASQKFGLFQLSNLLTVVLNDESGSKLLLQKFDHFRKNAIHKLLLGKELFSDITFQADDGNLSAHKAFLVCSSELMSAMFGSPFVESGNKIVPLPGSTISCLQTVFEFLYTKTVLLFPSEYLDVIALANRLCLPDLINMLEINIIEEFKKKCDLTMTRDLHESIVMMLEIAQLHNAHNLAEWCIHHITINYNDVCRKSKMIKTMSRANQSILEQLRWPPVWYIKDFDNYERALKKKALQEKEEQKGKGNKKS